MRQIAKLVLLLLLLGGRQGQAMTNSVSGETSQRIEAAHQEIWKRFISPNGLLFDWAPMNGKVLLPTPEECAQGKPNAFSWNTPFANCGM
ncbi:MAG: hypothetical protein WCS94_18680, partial [Verrucomicrobiota bacterium]